MLPFTHHGIQVIDLNTLLFLTPTLTRPLLAYKPGTGFSYGRLDLVTGILTLTGEGVSVSVKLEVQ